MKALSLVLGSILVSSVASAEFVTKANMYDINLDRHNGNDSVEILEDSLTGERLLTINLSRSGSDSVSGMVVNNREIFEGRPETVLAGNRVRFSLEARAANGNRNPSFDLVRTNQMIDSSGNVRVVENRTTARLQDGEFKVIGQSRTTIRIEGNRLIEDMGSINLLVTNSPNKSCSRTVREVLQNGSVFDGTIRTGLAVTTGGRLDGKDRLFPIYELGVMSLATTTSYDLNNISPDCRF